MSKDLIVSVSQSLDFSSIMHEANAILLKILHLKNSETIPQTTVTVNREYYQGVPQTNGHKIPTEQFEHITLGPTDTDPVIKTILELQDTSQQTLLMCFESPGQADWRVILESSRGVGNIWAIAIGLAMARLGEGRFINYEMWPDSNYSEDPNEFINLASTKLKDTSASFELAANELVLALEKPA